MNIVQGALYHRYDGETCRVIRFNSRVVWFRWVGGLASAEINIGINQFTDTFELAVWSPEARFYRDILKL